MLALVSSAPVTAAGKRSNSTSKAKRSRSAIRVDEGPVLTSGNGGEGDPITIRHINFTPGSEVATHLCLTQSGLVPPTYETVPVRKNRPLPGPPDKNGHPTQINDWSDWAYSVRTCGDTTTTGVEVCIEGCRPGDRRPSVINKGAVIRYMYGQIRLHVPKIQISPRITGGGSVAVGVPFFWTVPDEQMELIWLAGEACNEIACEWVWVIAEPQEIVFQPGEGSGDDEWEFQGCDKAIGPVSTNARAKEILHGADSAKDCSYTFRMKPPGNAKVFKTAFYLRYKLWGPGLAAPEERLQWSEVDIPVKEFQAVIVK
jgi:hypothetical protein